jgi:ADP-ribosylglycohydrolase
MEAALWAFYNSENYEEGCLLAVNWGEDADTTGAIDEKLAGAYYGKNEIPRKWINKLADLYLIDSFIERLWEVKNPKL